MSEFRQVECMMDLTFFGRFYAYQRQAGGLGAGINLEDNWLKDALLETAILEPNGKRRESMHHCALLPQQPARPDGAYTASVAFCADQ
jgi:hypothetical protein